MFKYQNLAIVLSFFCLWLTSFISKDTQIIIGFSLIFSFGILHGANDLKLIYHLEENQNKISTNKILLYYVFIVFAGLLAFYWFPLTAILIFITISGYHFGEQQWQNLKMLNKNGFAILFKTIYGFFILFLLFYFHQLEVQNIIKQITKVNINLVYFPMLVKVFGVLLSLCFLYLYKYVKDLRIQIIMETFYLLVFVVIFLSSNLIWGFAIFFVIWHSIPSILDQIQFLYEKVTFQNFKLYFKSAFLYWAATLLGVTLLYFIFKNEKIFIALFFSFLAAITFPHALVILKMFGNKNNG